jgi:Protein of unknown function (DUF2934)
MNSITLSTIAKAKPPEPMLEHEIRLRAYDLYQQRGRMDGQALDDWLQAEAEVLDLTDLLYQAEPSGVQNESGGHWRSCSLRGVTAHDNPRRAFAV